MTKLEKLKEGLSLLERQYEEEKASASYAYMVYGSELAGDFRDKERQLMFAIENQLEEIEEEEKQLGR